MNQRKRRVEVKKLKKGFQVSIDITDIFIQALKEMAEDEKRNQDK